MKALYISHRAYLYYLSTLEKKYDGLEIDYIEYTISDTTTTTELKNFKYYKISYDKAIKGNPYYENPRKKDLRHDRFEELLKSRGLKEACKECMTVKERIRQYIPQPLIDMLHKL